MKHLLLDGPYSGRANSLIGSAGGYVEETDPVWNFVISVTGPAVLLVPATFIEDIAARLSEAGIQEAVAQHDSATIYDWLMTLISLQGISDRVAFEWDARHGGVSFAEIEAALKSGPACPRLRCYWSFEGCGYRKEAGTCAKPGHVLRCPLPRHQLRKGGLNVAAYSLFLFIRDVCGGDIVRWMDERLAWADPGATHPDRAARMREAVLGPLGKVHGTGRKLWSMMLAELLLVGDPARERWVTTGASFVAVDTLVHNFLHRSGVLRQLGAEHAYGDHCYWASGCAEVIRQLAERIDARELNPTYPATFPRLVQFAIWNFCAEWGWNICNGNRIDDRAPCGQRYCPASHNCDRVSRPSAPSLTRDIDRLVP